MDAGRRVEHRPATDARTDVRTQLARVAGVATTLAYAVGAVGIVLGAIAFRDGEPVLAALAWVLAFAAGAGLVVAGLLARAVAALLRTADRLEQDVRTLVHRSLDP